MLCAFLVAAPVRKLVPHRFPLFLNERRKAVDRAVVRIEHELRQRHHLRRAIPALRAVYQHRRAAVNAVRAADGGAKHTRNVVQPVRLVQISVERRIGALARQHAVQAQPRLAHLVNVFDAGKLDHTVGIVARHNVLKAATAA